jgi:hypothetical protein
MGYHGIYGLKGDVIGIWGLTTKPWCFARFIEGIIVDF